MQTFRVEIRQSQFEFKQKSQRCDDLTANSMFCRSRASDNNSSSIVPSFIGKVRLTLFLFKIYLIIYCKLLMAILICLNYQIPAVTLNIINLHANLTFPPLAPLTVACVQTSYFLPHAEKRLKEIRDVCTQATLTAVLI